MNTVTSNKGPVMDQSKPTQKFMLRLNKPDFWNTPNPEMERKLLEVWRDSGLRNKLLSHRSANKTYWLLDGPPYANGDAHLGHLLNKTLKDVNARYHSALGEKVVWRAGWDCHGLPLELAVEKRNGLASKLDKLAFMSACRTEASTWVGTQKETMHRLGLLANDEQPWLTMDPQREAKGLELLLSMWEAGLLVERHSPVHWCSDCQSALAASELEKTEKPRRELYFLANLTASASSVFTAKHPELAGLDLYLLAWTTTPWTLFANTAFAYPEKGAVTLVTLSCGKKALMSVDARNRLTASNPELFECHGYAYDGELDFTDLPKFALRATSPMSGRDVPLLPASFANTHSGTGFVHVAPAFGPEDFTLHETAGVEMVCHVGTDGRLHAVSNEFAQLPQQMVGLTLEAATEETLNWMHAHGYSVHTESNVVEVQTCWRHKKPVFYRASAQWALDLEKPFVGCPEGLSSRARKALDETVFLPDERAKAPLVQMLATRRYWTLSRDRVWGLPLPFYRHAETGELHPETSRLWKELCLKVTQYGVEAWASETAPAGYVKESQVVDVWFDSGSAWHHAAEEGLHMPDLAVEGRDQTRGWFLSSFLLHAFRSHEPAFKAVMTHSFVVGENGLKLSKSTGGGGKAFEPRQVLETYSADAFRLWVCTQTVGDEARWSKTSLAQATQELKDWRSFLRFFLANMAAHPNDSKPEKLTPLDMLALSKAAETRKTWLQNMNAGRFNQALTELNTFRLWASSEWFEVKKRTLYCAKDSDLDLLSMQWALQQVFELFVCMLNVFMPFSAEEAYQAWGNKPNTSVNFEVLPMESEAESPADLLEALNWRKKVLPLVEKARGFLEKGTPVTVVFERDKLPSCVTLSELRAWFGTCFVTLDTAVGLDYEVRNEELSVRAGKAQMSYTPYRCPRCRDYYDHPPAFGDLCELCVHETR